MIAEVERVARDPGIRTVAIGRGAERGNHGTESGRLHGRIAVGLSIDRARWRRGRPPRLLPAAIETHAACAGPSTPTVNRALLARPPALARDIGWVRQRATTSSPEAFTYYEQGMAYLHGYVYGSRPRARSTRRSVSTRSSPWPGSGSRAPSPACSMAGQAAEAASKAAALAARGRQAGRDGEAAGRAARHAARCTRRAAGEADGCPPGLQAGHREGNRRQSGRRGAVDPARPGRGVRALGAGPGGRHRRDRVLRGGPGPGTAAPRGASLPHTRVRERRPASRGGEAREDLLRGGGARAARASYASATSCPGSASGRMR